MTTVTSRGRRYSSADDVDELAGRRERLRRARAYDTLRDPTCEPLLAVLAKDLRQTRSVVLVQHVRSCRAGRVVHPHVKWRVVRVREPAFGLVQLQGRDTEVEEHAVDPIDVVPRQDGVPLVIDRVHGCQAVRVRLQALRCTRECLTVPINTDETQRRESGEQLMCMTAETQGGVDEDGI